MKRKTTWRVKDYFTFNRSEQRGITILLVILSGLVSANVFIPAATDQPLIDFAPFEKEVRLFEQAWQKAAEEKKNKFQKAGDSLYWKNRKPVILFTVELNSADTFELQRLRGIGPSFARRIAGYRQRLGGYIKKEQLLEVFGMDSSRYYGILPNISVSADSIRQIDLNQVTFKELLRHPYFPFEVTKAIMIYRLKNKRFKSIEELKIIEGISDSLFLRMVPYLRTDL